MSLNPYLKIYDDNNLKNLNAQKNLIEENANKNIADLQAEGELAKKEAEVSYEGLINTQNVQRLINEKKIAETMANLGLSDSGLNRTQQTAVQLSHSNAMAQLQLQRQKKVDEIARLVQQQVGAVKTQLSQDLMKTQSAYDQSKTQWAGEQYNAQLEAEAKAIAELNKAQTANNSTRETFALAWNTDGATPENVTQLITNMELYPQDATWQKPAQNYITTLLNDPNASEDDVNKIINQYLLSYGNEDVNGNYTDKFILNITNSPEFTKYYEYDAVKGRVVKKKGRAKGTLNAENNTYTYFNEQGVPQQVLGVGKDATLDGMDILNEMSGNGVYSTNARNTGEQIIEAFRKGDIDKFVEARKQAINDGYSGYSIDHMMWQNFGDLWLLAAATLSNYNGLNNTQVVVTDDGGKNWGNGLNRNTKVKAGNTEKTIGEWHRYAKSKGFTPEASKSFLKNYGQN